MAITFVGDGSDTQNSNTISVPWPSTSNNDVAVLFWRYRTNLGTVTGPSSGWTLLGTQTTNTDACRVYYRVCNGSESGSVNLNVAGTAGKQQAILSVYRGVDTTTPINASNSIASLDPPAVTTTVANTTIIISASVRSSTLATFTVPAGYTFRGGDKDLGTTGGGASTLGVADSIATRSSGSVNPDAYESTITTNPISWTVALRPGASGTNYNETATALAASASLGNASSTKASSTGSGSLGTSAALSGAGSAAANASTSLGAEASVTATGSKATSATTSLPTDVSLTATGSKVTDSDADTFSASASVTSSGTVDANATTSFTTETQLSSSGSAQASVDTELLSDVSVTSTGSKATSTTSDFDVVTDFEATGSAASVSDADVLSADASLSASGIKGTDASADALVTDAAVSSAATAAANATAPLNTEAGLDSTGNADASASSELLTESSLTSAGSTAAFSEASVDVEVALGPVDPEAGFFAAVSELSGSVDVESSGTVDASTDAETMSLEISSEPYPWVELVSAADVFEAVSLFAAAEPDSDSEAHASFTLTMGLGPVEAFLGTGATTVFSTEVTIDPSGSIVVSGGVEDFSTVADMPIAGTDSGAVAWADPMTVSVTLESAGDVDMSSAVSFDTVLELGEPTPVLGMQTEAPLQIAAEYGTATVTRSVDFSILVKLSLTQTSIPDPLMDTEIDFLDMETLLPSTAISTVVDDPSTLTRIPATSISTGIDDPLTDTEIDFLDMETLIDDPETSTEIPSPGIATSANGA